MKKSFSKSLKLEIKPVFQFSATETNGQSPSDPTTITITTTTYIMHKPDQR
ncbi:hypothetical protein OQY15_02225 [Pedobacter sp. MC2016-15]|uniref:hypothetical protein n=1 Tax=Pedobacter sp. MC2016-15 TaxID=2994473 RepID=UPI00224539AE|nr:hypothetical protein [Pedobacter sp. MC2016-15]MCX2477888.1 hypothetical protein [Pedobacter sp. MC2016-15]